MKLSLIRILLLSWASCFLLFLPARPEEPAKPLADRTFENRKRPECALGTEFRRWSGGGPFALSADGCRKVSFLLLPSAKGFLDSRAIQGQAGNLTVRPRLSAPQHRFWDRENDLLFAAVAASRTLDYFSTLNMRRRGNQEIFLTNDVVDNHPAFAAVEAAATLASVGASYLFHRYHHHRLERWTSIVHAGLATSGAVRNYCLKTQPSSPAP